jgi:hypothetical protein
VSKHSIWRGEKFWGGTKHPLTKIFRIDRFRFLYYEPFFNMKNCQFQSVSQLFSTFFLYSLIAKCRNISNRPFSFFYIVNLFSTVSDRFHPYWPHTQLLSYVVYSWAEQLTARAALVVTAAFTIWVVTLKSSLTALVNMGLLTWFWNEGQTGACELWNCAFNLWMNIILPNLIDLTCLFFSDLGTSVE